MPILTLAASAFSLFGPYVQARKYDSEDKIDVPIPSPTTISPQARSFLDQCSPNLVGDRFPAMHDDAAWRAYIDVCNERLMEFYKTAPVSPKCDVTKSSRGGVPTYEARLQGDRSDSGVVLYLHGGGLVIGGGEVVGKMCAIECTRSNRPLIAVDYRNPPDHPYPAALQDCFDAYKAIIAEIPPRQIIIAARSGGGNLAVALVTWLSRFHIAMPAGMALFSPEVDLTEAGDSFTVLRNVDNVLPRGLKDFSQLYANGKDLSDPELSPLYGEISSQFPPTFLQSGTRDLLLSNTVLMHRALRRAGVPADLHIWEAMPHGGFGGATPEDAEVAGEYVRFIDACLEVRG